MSLLLDRSACRNFSHSSALCSPLQNGQLLAATTANAAVVDLMRFPFFHSGRDGFDEGVRCSDFDADGFVSSLFDLESSPACHWANSRNFCKLSSSSVASGPMFVSQAFINAGGNLSCNIGIRPSLKGKRPENGSLSRAVRQRKCFVTSSTSDWMPFAVISRHAGALHRAARCSRTTSLGRPKRFFRMSTAWV
ncbi:hypothetical protein T11_14083 [Trichinella zimbabwensis]|uniref:Uncharacterized protein n=1 Tax=Trichinella zimbabwensis TaxID=268475 RepID=A0A0V1GY13_9BILA|nr:hypothetical protein T11_14083 [Trichinella zimbabwensis]